MPVDHWLASLSQGNPRFIDGDLAALGCPSVSYPFLAHAVVASQIELLSGHLAQVSETCRRLAIAYSLYMRQMDAIQDTSVRVICAGSCDRPPVGCCNANHHVILSPSDVMVSRPTNTAMHLAHVITGLQRSEHEHRVEHGSALPPRPLLLPLQLRLHLEPLQVPPLRTLPVRLRAGVATPETWRSRHGLHRRHARRGSQTITSSRDFTDQKVLSAAVLLFPNRV